MNQTNGTPKLDALRTTLIDAISDPEIVPPYELKLLYISTFHLPTDTPEMMQLHEIQFGYKKEQAEMKREMKFMRYMIIGLAIGSGLLKIITVDVLEAFLRGWGLF
ncbi:MAG: hypothetical protein HeimC3_40910 [Candidatus Heimdallarchaeota archaeon LC_3]|nr:MAG: hypothetical protein HeimC3_40910 [Candidatus Heimdallarchaeota archaeon LC_3]